MMHESFRECDLVDRFGGEEFVVIVLSEDGSGATRASTIEDVTAARPSLTARALAGPQFPVVSGSISAKQ